MFGTASLPATKFKRGIAHPAVVVFLAVLGQVFLHIPPLMKLATLHFHLFTEDAFHTGRQCFRSVNHHQIPPLQIRSAVHQIFQQPFDHRARRSMLTRCEKFGYRAEGSRSLAS